MAGTPASGRPRAPRHRSAARARRSAGEIANFHCASTVATMTFSRATHSVTRTSRAGVSIRLSASIHCARLTATTPLNGCDKLELRMYQPAEASPRPCDHASRHSRSRADIEARRVSGHGSTPEIRAATNCRVAGDCEAIERPAIASFCRLVACSFAGAARFLAFQFALTLGFQPFRLALLASGSLSAATRWRTASLAAIACWRAASAAAFWASVSALAAGAAGRLRHPWPSKSLRPVAIEERIIFGADRIGLDHDRPLLRVSGPTATAAAD